MADHDIIRRGTDPNGRALYASRFMWRWWDAVCAELGFTPTIVQGAHMTKAGGGASASAGYHDGGGCFDLRVWDRTDAEVVKIIRVTRAAGAGSWVRDERHGMDPHIHFVLGADHALDSGARFQWDEYLAGRSGLSTRGKDYHWRPSPIVTDGRVWLNAWTDARQRARAERVQSRRDSRLTESLTVSVRRAARAGREKMADRLKAFRRRVR